MQNYLIKSTFFLSLIFGACISPKRSNPDENSGIAKSESCFIKQELVYSDEDESMFEYGDVSFEIKPYDTLPYILTIDSLEYPIDIDLTVASIDLWNYKCADKEVVLVEGYDYYSSIFYAYYVINGKLYYLGYLYVSQPNVEDEGIFEKEFKISHADDRFEVVSFLNGNVYDTVVFKEMQSIPHL